MRTTRKVVLNYNLQKIFFVKVRHALKSTFTVDFNAAHFYFELPLWQFNFCSAKTVKMRTTRKVVLNYNLQKIFFVKVKHCKSLAMQSISRDLQYTMYSVRIMRYAHNAVFSKGIRLAADNIGLLSN